MKLYVKTLLAAGVISLVCFGCATESATTNTKNNSAPPQKTAGTQKTEQKSSTEEVTDTLIDALSLLDILFAIPTGK